MRCAMEKEGRTGSEKVGWDEGGGHEEIIVLREGWKAIQMVLGAHHI
jgi:hypothetical protein